MMSNVAYLVKMEAEDYASYYEFTSIAFTPEQAEKVANEMLDRHWSAYPVFIYEFEIGSIYDCTYYSNNKPKEVKRVYRHEQEYDDYDLNE